MAQDEDFSSEEYYEKLKEKEIEKTRERERWEFLDKNSYLKNKKTSGYTKRRYQKPVKDEDFSSEEYFEKLKDTKESTKS